MLLLLTGAWYARTYNLTVVPPGLESDTSHVLFDALRLARGYAQPLDFDTRPEPFWRFIMAGWFLLVGPEIWTSRIPAAFVGLLTIAMTYRTALTLFVGRKWRYIAALVAAGAMAGIVPHLFMSRTHYRVIFTPLILLISIHFLLRASQTHRERHWIVGGFFATLNMHTYIAGLMTPFLAMGYAVHQLLLPPKGKRASVVDILLMLVGAAIPLMIWLLLFYSIPDLYARVGAVGEETNSFPPTFPQIWDALQSAYRAIHATGYEHALYNRVDTPLLNPTLVPFFYIGLAVAVWRLRSAEGAILLGGLILFLLPAGLSQQTTHSVRLLGTYSIASLLVGWGMQSFLVGLDEILPQSQSIGRRLKPLAFALLAVFISGYALWYAHSNYQEYFSNLDNFWGNPETRWWRIPHNYTLAFYEILLEIEQLERPTYVPYEPFNTSMGGYMLQRYAYPNVVSWARYAEEHSLTMLPAGDVVYPHFGMYHREVPRQSAMQLLLLPDEDTMVVIPPYADGSPAVEYPTLGNGRGIFSNEDYWQGRYGWYLGRRIDRDATPAPWYEIEEVDALTYTAGDGLHLVGIAAPEDVVAGETMTVTLLWEVSEPQPATLYSVVQLLDVTADWTPVGSQVQHMHEYVFPSSYWEPGDIIPQQFNIPIDANLNPGVFSWGVGVYSPPGSDYLPSQPETVATAAIANMYFFQLARYPAVQVNQSVLDEANVSQVDFEDSLRIEAYKISQVDNQTHLTVYWRALDKPAGDYTVFVHAENNGQLVAQRDERPFGGRLPTWSWRSNELIETNYVLDASNPDKLYIGLYDNALQRLPITASDALPISENRVELID